MSTPTCRTCETKFPGKDVCKTCGADPNAEPTLDHKIEWAMIPREKFTAKKIAKIFGIPTSLIVDPTTRRKERAARRARVRSLQNTKTSGRNYKHARVGVR